MIYTLLRLSWLLLMLPCACVGPALRQPSTLTGSVSWSGEVRLHGDVVLAPGAELTIAPGTKILFEAPGEGEDLYREHPYFLGSELIVRGRLKALGTSQMPIVFRYHNPQAPAGSWGGINIEDSPESLFSYVLFEQADSALHTRQSRVRVDHSIFRNNLVGLRFHDTQLLAEKNLFEHNGTAVRFHFGSPVLRHNLVRNNGKGIFISSKPQDYLIEKNAFINNRPYQVSLGEGVREDVDLRNNYWGAVTPEQLESLFFDGRVDDWLGRIVFEPMLEDENWAELPE